MAVCNTGLYKNSTLHALRFSIKINLNFADKKRVSGSLLIELLITIAISSLLLGCVFGILYASQRSYHLQASLNSIAHHAAMAIDLLTEDIQAAGYIGCKRLNLPIQNKEPYVITPQNKLRGTDTEILIRRASLPVATLINMLDASILAVDSISSFSPHDVLMISDCRHAEIFAVKRVMQDQKLIVTSEPLLALYGKNAEISYFMSNHYFVGPTARKDQHGHRLSALFVRDIHHRKLELVEGITHLAFNYAVLVHGQLQQLKADQIADWSKVRGVSGRIEIFSAPLRKHWYFFSAIL